MIDRPEHAHIDDVGSPLGEHVLELCGQDFLDTFKDLDVPCISNCLQNNLSLAHHLESYACRRDSTANTANSNGTTSTSTVINNTYDNLNSNHSILYSGPDDLDNEISDSIDFSSSSQSLPPLQYVGANEEEFDLSSMQHSLDISAVISPRDAPEMQMMGSEPKLMTVYEEDYITSVASYPPLQNSDSLCTYFNQSAGYMPCSSGLTIPENTGIYNPDVISSSEMQPYELGFHGHNDKGRCPNPIQRLYNPGEFPILTSETQHMGASDGLSLTSDISNLNNSSVKASKASNKQRQEKIHRYLKKKNERNFCKKIKYACRKTLADSRPRVRGRFAKNDEFGEAPREGAGNQEEDGKKYVAMERSEETEATAKGFSHTSGASDFGMSGPSLNSFDCGYGIQPWIE